MGGFTSRLIINFTIVVTLVMLTIYYVFDQTATHFIHNHIQRDFTLELINHSENSIAIYQQGALETLLIANDFFIWDDMEADLPPTAITQFFDLPAGSDSWSSFPMSVMRDATINNYLILNHRGELAFPLRDVLDIEREYRFSLEFASVQRNLALKDFYLSHREEFSAGQPIRVELEEETYYVKQVFVSDISDVLGRFYSLEFSEATEPTHHPYTVLLYSDVSEILAFKHLINQVLFVALILSGAVILLMSVTMSLRFNRSIKKLSGYSRAIGNGDFQMKVPRLAYSEFKSLGRQMEQMSQRLQSAEASQKQFFQNASHELRTPLMAIQCYNEGILAKVLDPMDSATIIQAETEKMTELVSQILALSQLDNSQNTALKLVPTSINDLLLASWKPLEAVAMQREISLSYSPLPFDLTLPLDAQLMKQALANIFSNALRYAKTTVQIQAFYQGNQLQLMIKNDGPVIDAKDLPHIFERFYKGPGGNTGIGLALTKEIITRMGGQIQAQNLPDGVCFHLSFDCSKIKQGGV